MMLMGRSLSRNGSASAKCMTGAFIHACGLATPMPEEEPESPGKFAVNGDVIRRSSASDGLYFLSPMTVADC